MKRQEKNGSNKSNKYIFFNFTEEDELLEENDSEIEDNLNEEISIQQENDLLYKEIKRLKKQLSESKKDEDEIW